MRFIFDGQLDGRQAQVPVQLGRWPDEPRNNHVRTVYEWGVGVCRSDELHEGEWRLLPPSPAGDDTYETLIAYRWRASQALALVVVNLAAGSSQAYVPVAADLFPAAEYRLC